MSYPNMLLALCTISPSSMGQHSCPRDESGPTYPLYPCSSASSSFNLVFSPAKDSHDEDGRVEKCGRPGKSCATKTQEAARTYPVQTGRDRRHEQSHPLMQPRSIRFYSQHTNSEIKLERILLNSKHWIFNSYRWDRVLCKCTDPTPMKPSLMAISNASCESNRYSLCNESQPEPIYWSI